VRLIADGVDPHQVDAALDEFESIDYEDDDSNQVVVIVVDDETESIGAARSEGDDV
jgi:hypothetical protein